MELLNTEKRVERKQSETQCATQCATRWKCRSVSPKTSREFQLLMPPRNPLRRQDEIGDCVSKQHDSAASALRINDQRARIAALRRRALHLHCVALTCI
jgi:hypothetical protein